MPDNNVVPDIEEEEEEVFTCVFCECDVDEDESFHSVTYRNGDLSIGYTGMSYRHNTNEVYACDDCIVRCEDCGELYTHSFMQNSPSPDNMRCDNCGEEYNSCNSCGSDEHNDDLNWDEDNDCYCNDCWSDNHGGRNRSRSILGYSERPTPIFGFVIDTQVARTMRPPKENRNDLFMGFELETNRREHQHHISDIAQWLLENSPTDYLYNKEDGSISGFEIVTHPCTLEAHKLLLPRSAIAELSSTYGLSSWSSVNGTGAGLHVHVSKKSFLAPTHIYKFQLFHYRNAASIKKFAGRESNRWATFDKNEYDNQVNMAKGNAVQNNRYSALNFQNAATIELRYFRGSLKPETVLGVLEFVHSVHKYTRVLTTKEVAGNGLSWERYKAWLSDESYEFLPSVMATRCV